jgi:SAM-dependent methyltransferase
MGPWPREVHQAREVAESFGTAAERYDRARPRYPDALIDRIVAASPGRPGRPGRDVLDVGCGTGIASRQFRAAGGQVLGVDPDAQMAGFARRRGLEVEVATFEDWDRAGRTFDAVVAGMTWHWVDPVAGAAKAAQALRPGGRLAAFWYVFQPPPGLGDAFAAVYRRVLPADSPFARGTMPGLDSYSAFFTKAADGIRQAGAFSDPEQWRFDWDHRYTRDQWLDMVPTFGGHSTFPPAMLDELLTGIGAAIDSAGGGFTMHCTAVAVTATISSIGTVPARPPDHTASRTAPSRASKPGSE